MRIVGQTGSSGADEADARATWSAGPGESVDLAPGREAPGPGPTWHLTLRTTILALLVAIIGILSGVLILTAWHYSASNAKTLSTKLMDRIAQHVVFRTTRFIQPAETSAALIRRLARSDVLRPEDVRGAEHFFEHLLRVYPQLAMLNLGDERGNFLMVKRFSAATRVRAYRVYPVRDSDRPEKVSPAEAALRQVAMRHVWVPQLRLDTKTETWWVPKGSLSTKIVRRTGTTKPVTIWKYRDLEGKLRAVSVTDDVQYDPRLRPWYRQSKHLGRQSWTGVYLFFTDNKPGVASTSPVFGPGGTFRGAISVELELYRISDFLAESKVGARSRVFLVNEEKEVVAFSDVTNLRRRVVRAGKAAWVLHKIRQIPDPEVVASYNALRRRTSSFPPKSRQIFAYEHGGETWQAMYIPFPDSAGKRWTVGIVVPQDVFLAQIKRNRFMSVFLSIVVIFGAIVLAVVLSRAISSPLDQLVHETERIKNLDLDGDIEIHSRLREVNTMVSSVDQMKVGLRSFEKYVPRELVRQLVVSGEEARVDGETRECTILFTDIAGFTSIAEGLAPEELITHLNAYFDNATNVLLAHGATIDKYIGDAIMAFWNAPREIPDHPVKACRAALELRRALDLLNADWAARGQPTMHTRIGLHTGEIIVGNIGSDERLSYTIIGDGVNLASRIEGINKSYGTWVMVSEETYRQVSDELVGRVVDVVAVKGRKEGVRLYELRCLSTDGDAERERRVAALSRRAFEHYRAREWDVAIDCFQGVQQLLGGEDNASALLIERCRRFREAPPPRGWTGVTIATKK